MPRYVSHRVDGYPFSPDVLISEGCQAIPLDGDTAGIPCGSDSAVHVAKIGIIPGVGVLVRGFHSLCVEHACISELDQPPFMQHLIGPHCGAPGTVFWVEETGASGCQPETDADPQALATITSAVNREYRKFVARQQAAGLPLDNVRLDW